MKIHLIVAIAIALSSNVYAQEAKKDLEASKTKMDLYSSRTGTITKFVDTKLPVLRTTYDAAETRIRKLITGSTAIYFYQIEKSGKYSNPTASIELSDLIEVIKAIKILKTEVANDAAGNPDYLENKFVTVDGFQVGYFVSKGKTTWYLKLEKYGSDNTVFLDSGDTIEVAFNDAKAKIDELKKLP